MVLSCGLLDVAFQGDDALGLHGLGQQEQQDEQVAVVAAFHLGPANTLPKPPSTPLMVVMELAIRKRRDGRAADRHHLVGRACRITPILPPEMM